MPRGTPSPLDGILAALLDDAPTDAVRLKLRNLHDVCRKLVEAGTGLTIPAVITEYRTTYKAPDQSMAEPSIRNKRGDKNLYNKIYREWVDHAQGLGDRRRRPGEAVTIEELASIQDLGLRARVSMTMAENRSLRSRVNILETLDKDSPLRIDGFTPASKPVPSPVAMDVADADDLAELRDFLDARKMKARGLIESQDGAIMHERGHLVADPGFLDALRRVTKTAR